METLYKFNYNRYTRITTAIYFVLFLVVTLLIAAFSDGGYFAAWFISLVGAVMALMVISIPRQVSVNEESLKILCVLEVVEIPIEEIVSINRATPKRGELIPLVGSVGFFGYYGFYLDTTTFERVMLYATELRDLVEIVNIYDDRYYISCREADQLIAQVSSYFDNDSVE